MRHVDDSTEPTRGQWLRAGVNCWRNAPRPRCGGTGYLGELLFEPGQDPSRGKACLGCLVNYVAVGARLGVMAG
jgi:hypothetical protein